MAYPPRFHLDGASHHVVARGNNRELVFRDEADYQHYLLQLHRIKKRWGCKIHAYALMPNHLHLLLAPAATTTLSQLMQSVTISYTKYVNRRYQRVGHVFQGRFRSKLIENDAYLLVASRYVHLNPVKAHLVPHPQEYRWSSYRPYLDPSADPLQLVEADDVLALMSPQPPRQRLLYRRFVELSDDSSAPEGIVISDIEPYLISSAAALSGETA